MSLLLLILIFLLKMIEAHNEGCNGFLPNFKVYECKECFAGYNRVNCPARDCVICFKCEITYCNECKGNVCSKCLDGFYLNNNQCLFCDDNCETCSGSEDNCDSCYNGYYRSNGECKTCDPNCYSCSGSATNCRG